MTMMPSSPPFTKAPLAFSSLAVALCFGCGAQSPCMTLNGEPFEPPAALGSQPAPTMVVIGSWTMAADDPRLVQAYSRPADRLDIGGVSFGELRYLYVDAGLASITAKHHSGTTEMATVADCLGTFGRPVPDVNNPRLRQWRTPDFSISLLEREQTPHWALSVRSSDVGPLSPLSDGD